MAKPFKRRVGPDPHRDGGPIDIVGTSGLKGCPDVWELDGGDFAIIGIDARRALIDRLPADASCGLDEHIVIVPREVMMGAAEDLVRSMAA